MADLLPCPFCGARGIDPEGWFGSDWKTGESAEGPLCLECGATAPSVEAWNMRAEIKANDPDVRP